MVEIIPALMPKSFSELREHVELFSGFVESIQIDVMDGVFVLEKSWPYSEGVETMESLLKDEQGLPLWESVEYEIDLMVEYPQREVQNWVNLCASRIIVHYESLVEPKNTLLTLHEYLRTHREKEGSPSLEFGLALDIATDNEKIYPLLDCVDFVQCMGIAKIGFQGAPFDERVISKIKDFKTHFPALTISVDGGVNGKSAPLLRSAGVNRLVSGSFLMNAPDISKAVAILKGQEI
ncbi:MAG: hypothetical protein WD003_00535 [Candidatus Paceibacterota bacterium]